MSKIWEYISVLLFGFIAGLVFWEQTQKPNEVTNIENNTKIKNNKAPIKSDVVTEVKQPKNIKERRKWLKKIFKHKNK